jgi:hypothetical protein
VGPSPKYALRNNGTDVDGCTARYGLDTGLTTRDGDNAVPQAFQTRSGEKPDVGVIVND